MNGTVVIDGDAALSHELDGDVSLISRIGGELGPVMIDGDIALEQTAGAEVSLVNPIADQFGAYSPIYTGATTVTPSGQTQTLHTKNMTMTSDITVEPIPSNYGLITWNGSTLMVS